MIHRNIFTSLAAHLPEKPFTVLIGARQTGKSTLLKQLSATLDNAVVLNLDRKDILLDLDQNPENIFKYVPQNLEKATVLIDEIQYLSDPTHFLKLLFDEHADRLKIVATGSSAFYIDRQFKDSLAGRKKIFELPTLGFDEFLRFKNQDDLYQELLLLRAGTIQKSAAEARLWAQLDEYINYGGYPAVVLAADVFQKIELLQEIRDSFIKRDILEAAIADETKFYRLMQLLASQTGNLLNINELTNTLRLSHTTVEQYLYVLQKCFHISLVRPFYQNLRKELVKMPKPYFNDFGLRNILINYFAPLDQRADKGALFENYVYKRLSEDFTKDQIKFWRTADGQEVDFIIENTFLSGQAIEVKFNESEAKPNKYKKFTEAYPQFPLSFWTWQGGHW
jgi:predicted AAA+ superfamily ATPase